MRQRIIFLAIAALAALVAIAPAASAHGGGHGNGTKKLCGIVDATSTLPTSVVIAKDDGAKLITVGNPNAADVSTLVVGQKACLNVTRTRNPDGTKTYTLVSVVVKPWAKVEARGTATLGEGTITVATLTFAVPAGMTLPSRLADGSRVEVRGSIAAEGAALTLDRIRVKGGHGSGHHRAIRHGGHGGKNSERVEIYGPVTAVTAATADAAGSVSVAGIALAVPAGKTLSDSVVVGAKAKAKAIVMDAILTLKKIRAHAAPAPAPVPAA